MRGALMGEGLVRWNRSPLLGGPDRVRPRPGSAVDAKPRVLPVPRNRLQGAGIPFGRRLSRHRRPEWTIERLAE